MSTQMTRYGLSKYEAEQALLDLKNRFRSGDYSSSTYLWAERKKLILKSMVLLASKKLPLPIGCLGQ